MSGKRVVLASLVVMVVASSCATSGGSRDYGAPKTARVVRVSAPAQSSETFHATYDKVWAATVGALADEGAPIQVVEKESGLVTTQFVQFGSGLWTDKQIDTVAHRPVGAGFLSIWSEARYSLSVHVTREDGVPRIQWTPGRRVL
jgi:hypothetical protein